MGRWAPLAVVVWCCSLAVFGAPGAARPSVEFYVAPAVSELSPGAVPDGASLTARIAAARGEREGFFIVLRAVKDLRASLQVAVQPLRGDGSELGPAHVQVWRAAWVDVDGRQVADALVPLARDVRDVVGVSRPKPGDDVVLYVEVSVPPAAQPGEYRGGAVVSVGDAKVSVPVALTVLPVELPARPSLGTAFAFSAREAMLGSGGKVGEGVLAGVRKLYLTTALADRIALIDADRVPSPACFLSDCLIGDFGGVRWWRLSGAGSKTLDVASARPPVRAIAWWAFAGRASGLRHDDAIFGFGSALFDGTAPRGALFYPLHTGARGEPTVVGSVRLKLLRDGLEDYELLQLAKSGGHEDAAAAALARISPKPGQVATDPGVWQEVRRELAKAISTPVKEGAAGPKDEEPAKDDPSPAGTAEP